MATTTFNANRRVLAVASGGGHWVQLMRLRPAFDGCDVAYATVHEGYASDVPGCRFYRIADATRWNKLALLWLALQVLVVLLRERPDVVISTGAAPGYFAVRLARLVGARTIWLDSIANVEQLSMSGRMARPHVDLCLTQWPALAARGEAQYAGGVL